LYIAANHDSLTAMRWLTLLTVSTLSLFAQVPGFNESGIALGHVHLMVKDPDAQKKVWMEVLGATEAATGNLKMLKLPGIFIVIGKAEPAGGSNGSTVNHIGFLTRSYAETKAKLVAANIKLDVDSAQNKQIICTFPDEVRIEFNEDANISQPIVMHHMHLSVTDPEETRAWYVKTFGAAAGSRRNLPAAMFPGGEVDFLKAREAQAPSKGRSIDHIGFEVKDLDAFARKLEAEGVQFDMKPRDMRQQIGLKIAFIIDPAGTRIELTEGLANVK
jgi:catechol 2,3-dioxygenase-like lactoylglutathione lyase family enzyme